MTETKKAVIENVKDFNTDHIFDCGQCFRFEKEKDGSWTGTAFDRIINVRFEPYNEAGEESSFDETTGDASGEDRLCDGAAGEERSFGETTGNAPGEGRLIDGAGDTPCEGRLIIENADQNEAERIWRPYFDLDRDYGAIKKELSEQDPVIDKAIGCGYGIRILRQDPWETVVSFIISQNNNIPRIKKCIGSLAENFGEKIGELRGRAFFSLPSAGKLAGLDEKDLACCRLGYRAKYLVETARVLAADGCRRLNGLASDDTAASSEEAFEYVSGLTGVGPKVANCILLFGLSKYDRFPIDVWMKRVMSDLYGFRENDVAAMAGFAEKTYGKWGGIAQQYLFYYARER